MIFEYLKCCGRDCFYPVGNNAKKFVDSFPHSGGNRKSLTKKQIKILLQIGVPCICRAYDMNEFK